jgi:hypothetical protein
MPTLPEVQRKLRRFIADGDASECLEAVDGIPALATDRLGILRNNSLVTHTSALAAVFPVVRRLVDPGFFAYLAHEFLRENPPVHPCLSEYGEVFPGFLARFPPVARIVYLEDVARLEWAISRVATAPAEEAMSLRQFASRPGDPACARFRLNSKVRLVASAYPIDLIWQMNQVDNELGTVRLDDRAAYLEVRGGRTELLRQIDKADWIFRCLVAGGDELGVATETTLQFDRRFDLAGALARLFAEALVVSCE